MSLCQSSAVSNLVDEIERVTRGLPYDSSSDEYTKACQNLNRLSNVLTAVKESEKD